MDKISTLIQLDDKNEAYSLILDLLWDKSFGGDKLSLLNDFERPILISEKMQQNINSGGINSFFYNNAGKFIYDSLQALETIGILKVADIIKVCIQLFPAKPIPDDIEKCRNIMEEMEDENEIDKRWDELSNIFYKMKDYIIDSTLEYIKKNKSEFE
jgi:hypothetical protein